MAAKVSIPANMSIPLSGRPGSTIVPSVQSPTGLRIFSWLVVAYNVLVVLWGAVVRATGSGNGCGDHWPLCGGTVVQHWRTVASVIEFAHRASSGLAGVGTVILLVWTWRAVPRRHLGRLFAGIAMLLTLNEGLLGALLVVLHHTGTDQSPMRAFWLSLHLTNTLLLLAALALTAHFIGRQVGRMRGSIQFQHAVPAVIGLGATLFVGVSGSLAALGDTLYPARSLAEAFAQDFSPHANWLLHIRWIHPTLSAIAALCILFLVLLSRTAEPGTTGEQRFGTGALGLTVAGLLAWQIILGIADVLLLAPTWLQVLHLFGADMLWISLVVLAARLCVRPLGCPGASCFRAAAKPASHQVSASV